MMNTLKPIKRYSHTQGFTLLEVVLAVTITGLVLGSLFTLLAGSKQLAWRTADSLYETIKIRQVVNTALLSSQFPIDNSEKIFQQDEIKYRYVQGDTVEIDSEFEKVLPYELQYYQVQLPQADDVLIHGIRFHILELGETQSLGQ